MTLEQRIVGLKMALDDIAEKAASSKANGYYHDLAFRLINESQLPRHPLVKHYYASYHNYKEENYNG